MHRKRNSLTRIIEIKRGSAEYRENIKAAWKPLKEGQILRPGSWIQTGMNTLVYAKFYTNTVIQIRSASLLKIAAGHKSADNKITGRLNLALGRVRVRVDPNRTEIVDFRVVSPKLTTSVKGTIWEQERYIGKVAGESNIARVVRGLVKTMFKNDVARLSTKKLGRLCTAKLSHKNTGQVQSPGTAGANEDSYAGTYTTQQFQWQNNNVNTQQAMEDQKAGSDMKGIFDDDKAEPDPDPNPPNNQTQQQPPSPN